MKNLIFLFLIINTLFLQAQPKISAITKADLQELINTKGQNEAVNNQFSIYTINAVDYISVLAKVEEGFCSDKLAEKDIIVGTVIKDITTLKVPFHSIDQLFTVEGISHIDLSKKVKPLVDRIGFDTRLDSVEMALDLPKAYTGKGVYIGIIDWGFDYTHPAYYDTLMETYRIAAAWDQFKTSGPHPQGFDYGTEYVGKAELLAAGSDTSNIYGYAYHGGHVASIAGGGGAGTKYKGVAYESEFLMATFLIDEAAVIDAYEWMYQKSLTAGKRLVINQSWGLYHMGSLDGNSLLSQAIDNYADLGVVFTSSAGNNGSRNFHLEKEFQNDTLYSGIAFSGTTSPNFWGQSISVWGTPGKPFSVGFQVYTTGQEFLLASELYSTLTTTNYIDSFLVIDEDTVFYNLAMENDNPFNNRPHARLRVRKTKGTHYLVLKMTAEEGLIHAWNVAELTTDVGNMGTDFTTFGPASVGGDSFYGIGEPACTESVIAVAAHQAGFLSPSGNLLGGGITSFSSYGPLYNGNLKPDVSAPGADIAGAISSFADASMSFIETVDFEGKEYGFSRLSGSSMSSPVVAGICALVLEANPNLTAEELKSIIISTAYSDTKTGEINEEGDTRWGHGKIDAYNAIKQALALASLYKEEGVTPEIVLYPNPTSNQLHFSISLAEQMVYIYTPTGQLVMNQRVKGETVDVSSLNQGVYLIKLAQTNQLFRFIKK